MKICSFSEAKETGLRVYYTEKKCARGHDSPRYVTNCACVECGRSQAKKWGDDNREIVRARTKKWSLINKDYLITKGKQYRSDNKEKRAKARRQWDLDNPEKASAKRQNRRARFKGAKGRHTYEDIKRLRSSQKNKCAHCKISLKNGFHVDYIMPLAKGGSNCPENLQLLCAFCNYSKGAKDPVEWKQEHGMLI